jgi:two-component system LytT family response regulator
MYNCIIVDDQAEALDLIYDHVSKVPSLNVDLMTTDSIEALAFIDKKKPDLVFLDIEMPGLSGIEFIESIKDKWGNDIPKVVFTTGHSDYALSGYEHGIADYLLKPITFCRFKQCIDRIIDELAKREPITINQDYFFIEDSGKKVKFNFENIVYIEAAGNYITICLNGSKKTIYKSMTGIQDILPGNKFSRIHKSYIVALEKVQVVKGNEIVVQINNNERTLPIGVTYKENLMKQLGIAR